VLKFYHSTQNYFSFRSFYCFTLWNLKWFFFFFERSWKFPCRKVYYCNHGYIEPDNQIKESYLFGGHSLKTISTSRSPNDTLGRGGSKIGQKSVTYYLNPVCQVWQVWFCSGRSRWKWSPRDPDDGGGAEVVDDVSWSRVQRLRQWQDCHRSSCSGHQAQSVSCSCRKWKLWMWLRPTTTGYQFYPPQM